MKSILRSCPAVSYVNGRLTCARCPSRPTTNCACRCRASSGGRGCWGRPRRHRRPADVPRRRHDRHERQPARTVCVHARRIPRCRRRWECRGREADSHSADVIYHGSHLWPGHAAAADEAAACWAVVTGDSSASALRPAQPVSCGWVAQARARHFFPVLLAH